MDNTRVRRDPEFLWVIYDVDLCGGVEPTTTDGVDVLVYILV